MMLLVRLKILVFLIFSVIHVSNATSVLVPADRSLPRHHEPQARLWPHESQP